MLLVVLIASFLFLGEMAYGEGFSGEISTGVDSQYLVEPGVIPYEHPVWWGNLHLDYDGWHGNIWGSLALESERGTEGEELEFKLGKRLEFNFFETDIIIGYLDIAPVGDRSEDQWFAEGRLDLTEFPLMRPFFTTRYYGEVGEEGLGQGWFFWTGFEREQPLGFILPTQGEEFSLNLEGFVGFSAGGIFHGEAGPVFARLKASTAVCLRSGISLIPWGSWQIPIQNESGGYTDGKHHLVYGLAATYAF